MAKKPAQPPSTRDQMMERGYKFDSHGVCRGHGCKKEIEWWITPACGRMPVDLMATGDTFFIAHFATCVDVGSFRR